MNEIDPKKHTLNRPINGFSTFQKCSSFFGSDYPISPSSLPPTLLHPLVSRTKMTSSNFSVIIQSPSSSSSSCGCFSSDLLLLLLPSSLFSSPYSSHSTFPPPMRLGGFCTDHPTLPTHWRWTGRSEGDSRRWTGK